MLDLKKYVKWNVKLLKDVQVQFTCIIMKPSIFRDEFFYNIEHYLNASEENTQFFTVIKNLKYSVVEVARDVLIIRTKTMCVVGQVRSAYLVDIRIYAGL